MSKKKNTPTSGVVSDDFNYKDLGIPVVLKKPKLIAKKDFVILRNDFRADIKAGDDLSDIPDLYFQNLKTEKVI